MNCIIPLIIATSLALSIPITAFASDTKSESNVNLTVVIPSTKKISQENNPVSELKPIIPKLYPTSVYEFQEDGAKQIIKTYELSDNETPDDIPCDSFERGNWHYELTDIIKKETSAADLQEHTKTINIDTDTNEVEKIIKLLAPAIEYKSDDGYGGILNLDVKSINVETAKTKKNTFTISAIREYPYLSSNDTSFVPKTITDNGRTLTLSGLEWRTQTSSSVDYQELPTTYTAIATYTAVGNKTIVTGYSVTAEYKGSISKMITGKTVYTAIFDGKKISSIPVPILEQQTEKETIKTDSSKESIEVLTEETTVSDKIKNSNNNNSSLFIIILILITGFAIFAYLTFFILVKKLKKLEIATVENLPNIEELTIKENDEEGESIL